jgi:hypothetical protein
MGRKLKVTIVAAVLAALPLVAARPASAMTCDESIEDACRIAATVICKVVAKGEPCLM